MTRVLLPESLPELLNAIDAESPCHLLAGGTDLLVALREHRLRPGPLVCLERVAKLSDIVLCGGHIVVGAAAPLARIADHQLIRKHADVLCQAIGVLAAPPITHMATLGGNICTASPAGDTLPPLYVLAAEVELQSRAGTRRLPIADFIRGPRTTRLRPGEALTRIWIPVAGPDCRSAYFKVGRRKAQAISVVSLAARYWTNADGVVRDIRLAWGSVGPVVLSFPEIEAAIRGRRLSDELLRPVAARVERLVSPIDDLRASAAYRRQVAGNLLRRLPEMEGSVS